MLKPVYPDAVRLARAMAGSAVDGDDVLQDALMRAWKAYPYLRDKQLFKPWLLKIIGNSCRSWQRRRKLKNWVSLDFARGRPAPQGRDLEHCDLVRKALQALPPDQREAVVLFELTGASLEEVTTIQGVSLSAVKSRLARGRIRLKDRLLQLERKEHWNGRS
jgi:RNA polymerase sigma-70 factor (ECF subfamily)